MTKICSFDIVVFLSIVMVMECFSPKNLKRIEMKFDIPLQEPFLSRRSAGAVLSSMLIGGIPSKSFGSMDDVLVVVNGDAKKVSNLFFLCLLGKSFSTKDVF